MKTIFYFVLSTLLMAAVAQGQQKPWNPAMCKVPQEHASRAYVLYCLKASPNEYPACQMGDPREAMWVSQASGGKGAYFEVLDCSWHGGERNPREAHPIDKVVKSNLASYHLTGSADSHGCFTNMRWNPKLHRCEGTVITIISPDGSPVSCRMLKRGSLGEQPIFCFYTPKKAKP